MTLAAVFLLFESLKNRTKSLEVKEKNVPLQSQMKNGWLKRPEVLIKTDAENEISKIFEEKFGS